VFTLVAANNGPGAATGVVVTNAIEPGVTFIWASPGCTFASATVSCDIGTLEAGANARRTVVVRPGSPGAITNNVAVSGAQGDPSTANNSSSLAVPVDATPAGVPVQRYRLYSPVTLEHHFTTDFNEYNRARRAGRLGAGRSGRQGV
jgi:uncharacterized repeat protein (TIGR01451 family)